MLYMFAICGKRRDELQGALADAERLVSMSSSSRYASEIFRDQFQPVGFEVRGILSNFIA